eukprot:Sspe_Gene.33626::Locus_16395_Transcript_1_1_Confidence_1.000_Length_988::g.33626::m.33626
MSDEVAHPNKSGELLDFTVSAKAKPPASVLRRLQRTSSSDAARSRETAEHRMQEAERRRQATLEKKKQKAIDTRPNIALLFDYDREGQLILDSQGPGLLYNNCDVIWKHPITSGSVYVGNEEAARVLDSLEEHRITHIVNCQGPTSVNHHESAGNIKYLRFPIALCPYMRHPPSPPTHEEILAYFQPYFDFVDKAISEGGNVLVHCLAGAHRAGTAGVAFIMHTLSMNARDATRYVQGIRSVVQPIGAFPELLRLLEQALAHKPS